MICIKFIKFIDQNPKFTPLKQRDDKKPKASAVVLRLPFLCCLKTREVCFIVVSCYLIIGLIAHFGFSEYKRREL